MARPAFGLVLVGWLCAAGAAFLAMFDRSATDDMAGWVPVTVVMQVPAFLVLRAGRREAPLAGARRWALALPAALAAGVGVFWTMVAIGFLIWKPGFLELRPMLLGLGAGFAVLIAAGIGFGRVLRDVGHPRGARHVLLVVTALGAVGLAAMVLRFAGTARAHPAEWIVVALPVLWVLPLWLLLALVPPPESPLPPAIVSR